MTNDLLISYDPSNGEVVGRVQKLVLRKLMKRYGLPKSTEIMVRVYHR